MGLAFAVFARRFQMAIACGIAAFLIMAWDGRALAQEPPEPASVVTRFADWTRALDRISHDVSVLKLDATQIDAFADQAAAVRTQATAFGDEIQHFANEARELRDAFVASAPADASESDDMKAQRKALEDRVGLFGGWTRQVDLVVARADQLLDKISTTRLDKLAASLIARGQIPFNPLTWARAGGEMWAMAGLVMVSTTDVTRSWLQSGSETGQVAVLVISVSVVTWLLTLILVRLAARRSWPVWGPCFSGAVSRIMLSVLRSTLPWIAAITAAGLIAPLKDWLPEASGRAVVLAVITVGLIVGISLRILHAVAIRPPSGVTPLIADDDDRTALVRSLTLLTYLFAINAALGHLTVTFISANLIAVWALIFTVAGSVIGRSAIGIGGRVLLQNKATSGKAIRLFLLVVPPAIATASIFASALGYVDLGPYIFSNSLATAALFFVAWSLRLMAQEVIVRVCDAESPAGRKLCDRLGTDQPALRLALFWFGIVFDVVAVIGLVLGTMVVWGTGAEDALLMTERLIEGVRIGNITLSLADLIGAIFTFLIGVWLTRFAQRILDRRVFPGTQLDVGVRNSLRSGLGYIGVIVAGSIAVMALGINLSSLAFVAGALSVGIGFGMQNIINNFVSGLILLIERPVKVGDWITVSGTEGLVNRINVRSTEVVTGNRASVLIPNGDFLSVSVTNWTHKDRGARLQITFQLPEALGAEGGRDLLLSCAAADPNVQSFPPPRVLLQAIGGGYTFELEADVPDAAKMREVASDLRFAVDRELRNRALQ